MNAAWGSKPSEFCTLQLPDTVLGRDRSSRSGHEIIDEAGNLLAFPIVPVGRCMTCGPDMKMDVSIAEMAKARSNHPRKFAFHLGRSVDDETRHVGNANGYVMGERLTLRPLGFGNGIADLPECLGLRFVCRKDRIGDDPLLQGRTKEALELGRDVMGGIGRRRFDEDVPFVSPSSGSRVFGTCLKQSWQVRGHQLEAFDVVRPRLEKAKQLKGALRAIESGPGNRACRDCRHQSKCNRRDDSKRPFRADQELVEAVAPIVLLEAGEAVVDGAVGEHRFDPSD